MSLTSVSLPALLAEVDLRLKPVLNSSSLLVLGLVIAAVFIVTVIAAKFFHRSERRRCRNEKVLFRELCHAQVLRGTDRRLLARAAQDLKLVPASRLFVDPELWDKLLAEPLMQPFLPRLRAIRERLFAR